MIWHYALDGEKRGPVSDEEFQRLVGQGIIVPETLVWRDGMANWAPFGATVPPMPPPVSADGLEDAVPCAMCQRLTSRNDMVDIRGALYCAACKPIVLHRLMGGEQPNSPAEETRKLHLNHEASVKSIGLLYYLGGAALLLIGIAMAIGNLSSRIRPESLGMGVFFLFLGVAYFFVAAGVRKLRPWARVASGILCGIGLLGFPLGTLINGYFLYLLFSEKGATVFSPAYQEIIRQTPHIKYKTSIAVWILLAILVLALVGVIVAVALSSRH